MSRQCDQEKRTSTSIAKSERKGRPLGTNTKTNTNTVSKISSSIFNCHFSLIQALRLKGLEFVYPEVLTHAELLLILGLIY